ncbi:MAG: alpha/beta hydrolase [Crocosphaera sp.]|nr:alpha/beta hydrolase [Crocosphaera sp.]
MDQLLSTERHTEFIYSDEGKIFTTSCGKSRNFITCIHGSLGVNHDYLFPALKSLSNHYQLVFYDRRGVGLSQGDFQEQTYQAHLNDISQILSCYQVPKTHLIGHSWGSIIALIFAVTYPQLVEKIVLLNPVLPYSKNRTQAYDFLSKRLEKKEIRDFLDSLDDLSSTMSLVDLIEYQNFAYGTIAHFYELNNWKKLPTFTLDFEQEESLWDSLDEVLEGSINSLSLPMLAIYGDTDISLGDLPDWQQIIPDLQTKIIPKCGHFPMIEKPKCLHNIIENFLAV